MSIYPLIELALMQDGSLPLPSGSCIVIPVTLDSSSVLDIVCSQSPLNDFLNTEDFSLRVWVSQTLGGDPLYNYPAYLTTMIPNRYPSSKFFSLYDIDETAPDKLFPIGATPGQYFFHILNLINSKNACIVEFSKVNL